MKSSKTIGIYVIANVITGEAYIGASTDCINRFSVHRSASCNKDLSDAFNQLGITNFIFKVVRECQPEELATLEAETIARYKKQGVKLYNSEKKRPYPEAGFIFSEEAIAKLSKAKLGNQYARKE